MILRDLGPGVTRLHGVRGLSGLRAVQQLRQIPQVHHLFRGHVLLLDLHILRKFAGDGVLVRGAALELAQQLLQCALIGGRAHQLTVHIQTVRLGDQTDLLGQVLLQRRLVYHVLPQQQAGGILQQGVVDGVALPQRPGGDRLQVRRGLLRCGLGAHSGNHLAVVQNRRPEGVDGEEQPDGSSHAAAAQQHRWMQAPAVPQLGPQGRDPLTPLLPAGADPFAQQPPQSGQHSPGQQKQLHRKPLRLREPLCLFLPYQTPPVAAGILGLFRQRLAAGHHRADLPLRVLPGLHSLPQPPAPGLCPSGRTSGLLSPLGDQGLHRRRCGYGLRLHLRGLGRTLPLPLRLSGSQTLAAAAGLPGGMIAFLNMFAHIVSVKSSEIVTICYRL